VSPLFGKPKTLSRNAWLIIGLNALYSIAEALCSVFVGVYFYINSQNINTVFYHYTVLYIVTPFAFILAGWLAKKRDRSFLFRIGLILHALYYASLLFLREASPQYAGLLGGLLGITWGFFWAGNNTFQYDFSAGKGGREFFLGMISAVSAGAKIFAPLISGLVIACAAQPQTGYELIFILALILYMIAIVLSFKIPASPKSTSFPIRLALAPPPEHRDWRILLAAGISLAGSFHIFHFLLALIMFLELGNEAGVGGYVSFQGLVTIMVSYLAGRYVQPHTRKRFMFWGVVVLVLGGLIVFWKTTVWTLIIFGLLRSISLPLYGIPDTAVRFQVMESMMKSPADRIAYLCAWETPLAIGRLLTMSALISLYAFLGGFGLRIMLLLLCLIRVVTYALMCRISIIRNPEGSSERTVYLPE
jgi:YQGE family putative transporter